MRMPDDLVEHLARGARIPDVEMSGRNGRTALGQAESILRMWNVNMDSVLVALITRIQEQDKEIEMLQYQTKWRKRRP